MSRRAGGGRGVGLWSCGSCCGKWLRPRMSGRARTRRVGIVCRRAGDCLRVRRLVLGAAPTSTPSATVTLSATATASRTTTPTTTQTSSATPTPTPTNSPTPTFAPMPVGLAALTDLDALTELRPPGTRVEQISSYDRSGGNADLGVGPDTAELLRLLHRADRARQLVPLPRRRPLRHLRRARARRRLPHLDDRPRRLLPRRARRRHRVRARRRARAAPAPDAHRAVQRRARAVPRAPGREQRRVGGRVLQRASRFPSRTACASPPRPCPTGCTSPTRSCRRTIRSRASIPLADTSAAAAVLARGRNRSEGPRADAGERGRARAFRPADADGVGARGRGRGAAPRAARAGGRGDSRPACACRRRGTTRRRRRSTRRSTTSSRASLGPAARSLAFGRDGDRFYCYFPMPFRSRARIVVRNDGDAVALDGWRLRVGATDEPPVAARRLVLRPRRVGAARARRARLRAARHRRDRARRRGRSDRRLRRGGALSAAADPGPRRSASGRRRARVRRRQPLSADPRHRARGLLQRRLLLPRRTVRRLPTHGNPAQPATSTRRPGLNLRSAYRLFLGDAIPFSSHIRLAIEHGPIDDVPAEHVEPGLLLRDRRSPA